MYSRPARTAGDAVKPASVLCVQRTRPVSRSSAWIVPSRSPRYTASSTIAGAPSKPALETAYATVDPAGPAASSGPRPSNADCRETRATGPAARRRAAGARATPAQADLRTRSVELDSGSERRIQADWTSGDSGRADSRTSRLRKTNSRATLAAGAGPAPADLAARRPARSGRGPSARPAARARCWRVWPADDAAQHRRDSR